MTKTSTHNEDLAMLASRPEFKALLRLIEIEKNNIMIRSFKVNSSDPQIALKKAYNEGQISELVKIKKTFEQAIKGSEKDNG